MLVCFVATGLSARTHKRDEERALAGQGRQQCTSATQKHRAQLLQKLLARVLLQHSTETLASVCLPTFKMPRDIVGGQKTKPSSVSGKKTTHSKTPTLQRACPFSVDKFVIVWKCRAEASTPESIAEMFEAAGRLSTTHPR